MAGYVEGFVTPVKKKKLVLYKKLSKQMGKIALELGVLRYVECLGHDTPEGKSTSFPRSVKLKADEVVFLSWMTYKSRAHRDRVAKKFMTDPRVAKLMEEIPMDGRRLIWGGFTPFIVMGESKTL